MNDEEGFLYDFFEKLTDILTTYNDTVKGRCAVCLENFSLKEHDESKEAEADNSEPSEEEANFTDRPDLVRIDQCYHRFHLICLHRDWFMPRVPETDAFGGTIQYKLPEMKKCPICRRCVEDQEIQHICKQVVDHPEVDDKGYVPY